LFSFSSGCSFRSTRKIIVIIISMFMLTGILSAILSVPVYADTAPGYPGINPAPLIDIRDVLNIQGPDNTNAIFSVPDSPLNANSNAVDAAAVDFVDNKTSLNQASIFAAVTKDNIYEHSYQICNRFEGYTLDDAHTMSIPGLVNQSGAEPQFWYMSMSYQGVPSEKAYTFEIYVNEAKKTFIVDSLWSPWDVSKASGYNYIFNIQVWSATQQDSTNIVYNIISKLSSYNGWQVSYINTQPVQPSILVMDADIAKMRVENLLQTDQEATFTGQIRYPNDKSKMVPLSSFSQVLSPGVNTITLPTTNALDGNIFVSSSTFKDRVYVGAGYWLAFGKTMTESDSQMPEEVASSLTEGDFVLGGADLQGTISANSVNGLARTLNPNSLPVDISKYNALSFWAMGDGNSYSVQFETKSVRDHNSHDFHQSVITTDSEWRQYTIPFSSLRQQGTDPNTIVPWTGTDVISVAWVVYGTPTSSVQLEIKNAALINTENENGIKMVIGSPQMLVNGAIEDIDPGYQTAPTILSGRTMVPIRAIIEALGGTVDWSAPDQTLTIGLNKTSVLLKIGQKGASINGVEQILGNPPFLSSTGRTMLPLRFIIENLGRSVVWDDYSKTITIQ